MIGSTAFMIGYGSTPNRRQSEENPFETNKSTSGVSGEVIGSGDKKSSLWKWMDYFLSDIYLVSISFYSFWILCGILWYKYYLSWTWATAYYYTMDAGLSIGFCNPAEKDDWTKLFTIFYVLIGSSVISGCLGLFANSIFSNKVALVQVAHEFGAIGFDHDGVISIQSVLRCLWYHFKYFIGWYSNRSRTIIVSIFVVWMGLGTAYGMVVEHWSFISSLYWAITTSSTGGLQSAPCESGDEFTCNMGNMRGSLMGVFMMVGVPLYAAAIGQFAHIAVGRAMAAQEEKMLSRPIEDAEFIFAANILSPEGSTTLVLGEYILLELLRLGQTNQQQIEALKKRFYQLDRDKRGELDIWDLQQSGRVVPRKLSSIEVTKRIRSRSLELFGFSPTSLKQLSTNTNGNEEPVVGVSGKSSRRITKKSFIKSYQLPDPDEDGDDLPLSTVISAGSQQSPPETATTISHSLHRVFDTVPLTPPSQKNNMDSDEQRERVRTTAVVANDEIYNLNPAACFSDFDFIRDEGSETDEERPKERVEITAERSRSSNVSPPADHDRSNQ